MQNLFSIETIGLFIFLAGFVIGLGAVTVIDLHGFLARKSEYWTETTIRAHKVTKPLIWLGTILATIGGTIYYSNTDFNLIAKIHASILPILILNGLFLSFKISPYLLKKEQSNDASSILPKNIQRQITVSFLISFAGWWSSLLLLSYNLIYKI